MARSFNGTSDKITVGNTTSGSNYSFFAWANCTLVNGYNTVWGGMIGATTGIYIKSSGKTALYNNAASVWDGSGAATIGANTWVNIGWTLSGGNTITGYVNAVVDQTGTSALTWTSAGSTYAGDGSAGNIYAGKTADGALWNVVLSSLEIAALANGVRPGKIRPANLLFWHPLDGLQSPEPDLSNNKNNGTLTGTALAFGPPVMMLTPRRPLFIVPTPPPPIIVSPYALNANQAFSGHPR